MPKLKINLPKTLVRSPQNYYFSFWTWPVKQIWARPMFPTLNPRCYSEIPATTHHEPRTTMSVPKAVAATIRLRVPAGGARPAPPVGPALGQYRLNLMAFCKDFNARTQKYKADTPMAVTITAFKDNTFEFTVKLPSVSWYLKKAAGVESGSSRPGHVTASTLSVRHVHEIAKAKQSDPYLQNMPLESISKSIIGTANSMGIKIVKDLD